MARLFNRAVQITVGPKGSKGLRFRGLRISFEVKKTEESHPNIAKVEIYNLSKQSRSFIEEKNNMLIIDAGYGEWTNKEDLTSDNFVGVLHKLFIGDIGQVTSERRGPDIVTTIEAGDGQKAYQESKIDTSFAPGAKAGNILDTILGKFGIGRGSLVGFNEADQFLNGLSLSGMTRDHLDVVMRKQGLNWSIQDNLLQVTPPKLGLTTEAVLLNSSTGLIGSPFKTKTINASLLGKKDEDKETLGVKAISLLNGDLIPGRYVSIESELIEGVFKVYAVTHQGDTHDKTYYSNIEAK